MNEKLLHYIWKFQLFDKTRLVTEAGEELQIIHGGSHNNDAGPDFINVKIKIGKTLWVGNVEIHLRSGDWFVHKHQNNPGYDNVILHVVLDSAGQSATKMSKEAVATLVLKDRISHLLLQRYSELEMRQSWIPCQKFFPEVDEFTRQVFTERLLVERLENKVGHIQEFLAASGNDWESVLFQTTAKYFGSAINKEPFLQLAQSLPVKIWSKHVGNLLQVEALVFGQAGFLENKLDDEYPNQLRAEYLYLKRLHNLEPLKKHQWKFLRLRPSNFPTLRLAQFAALLNSKSKLFSQVINVKDVNSIYRLFDVSVSEYWRTHYMFDKPTEQTSTHMGIAMKSNLLINALVPVLFAYGKYQGNETYTDKAMRLLEMCHAENNSIIKNWTKLNWVASNAFESQAMLQLKNEYCSKFRCLECAVGNNILK